MICADWLTNLVQKCWNMSGIKSLRLHVTSFYGNCIHYSMHQISCGDKANRVNLQRQTNFAEAQQMSCHQQQRVNSSLTKLLNFHHHFLCHNFLYFYCQLTFSNSMFPSNAGSNNTTFMVELLLSLVISSEYRWAESAFSSVNSAGMPPLQVKQQLKLISGVSNSA